MIEFEKSYKIPVYDTDFEGKLSLFSLFNYVQDIASEHAEMLHFGRDDLQKANQFWILSRLYAEIRQFPLWGETVVLKTWPRGTEGLFALRDIAISSDEGVVIAGVTTSWVIVDTVRKRPQRPDFLLELMNNKFPDKRSLPRNAGKLTSLTLADSESAEFSVKASDLDVNHHVNNAKYILWVYDSFQTSFLAKHRVSSIEINYLSESVEGNLVIIRSQGPAGENNCSSHSVIRVDDGKELCRIMICWLPVPNQKVL
jgi:medium-chain acyl-[acyl-carrier-protein] hydrolase